MAERRAPRVILIKGACNYDHLRCFADAMKLAFEDEGAVAVCVDLAMGPPDATFAAALTRFEPDLVLSFNLDGVRLAGPDGRPLGGGRVPLTTWMVDEPYYQRSWAAELRAPHVRTLWTNERSSAEARAMELPEAETMLLAGRVLPRVRGEDRDIDVFFAGSVVDPEGISRGWPTSIGPAVAKLMGAASEAWVADLTRPLREVFRETCEAAGVGGHDGIRRLEPMVLGEINRFVRAKVRLAVMRDLADLPLTVVGDGWDRLVPGSAWVTRPAVPYYVYEEMVSRAKVTLCVQPVHGHVASERYFASLANGSALVVNDNRWLAEAFGELHAPFSLTDVSGARARLEALLSDEPAREEMAQAARERVAATHTWHHRARALLERAAKAARAA